MVLKILGIIVIALGALLLFKILVGLAMALGTLIWFAIKLAIGAFLIVLGIKLINARRSVL